MNRNQTETPENANTQYFSKKVRKTIHFPKHAMASKDPFHRFPVIFRVTTRPEGKMMQVLNKLKRLFVQFRISAKKMKSRLGEKTPKKHQQARKTSPRLFAIFRQILATDPRSHTQHLKFSNKVTKTGHYPAWYRGSTYRIYCWSCLNVVCLPPST